MTALLALIVFILAGLVNLITLAFHVAIPHLATWNCLLLFAGLALCVAGGVPVPWRR